MQEALKYLKLLIFWGGIPICVIALIFALSLGVLAILVYSFLALLLISRIMVYIWLKPLTCEREIKGEVVNIGEKVYVATIIQNKSPLPVLWTYGEESLPEKMPKDGITKRLFFLPPGRSFHFSYNFIPTRRGCHQVGPMILETGDIFGLFKKCKTDKYRDFVTALPAYGIIEEYRVGERRNLGDYTAVRSIFEDPSRLAGIRDYIKGDPLKKIHWKASAHSGRLCSKVYEPVTEAGATVVLDFHERSWVNAKSPGGALSADEYGVELACSLCKYLADGKWRVGFFSNGRDPLGLPGITIAYAKATESLHEALQNARASKRKDSRLEPIYISASRSPEQFSIIREQLGRIELSDGLPVEDVLMLELPHIDRQQVLAVITGDATDSFVQKMLTIRSLGYRLMVFIVGNTIAHDKIFEEFTPHNIEVFSIDAGWRINEISTGRRNF